MPDPRKETSLNAGTILDEWKKSKGTASDAETQSQTASEQPKSAAPVAKSADSKESPAGAEWKKRIPSQYHADLEGLDEKARAKVLDMIDGLDKPRQADYTKKTQAHAERIKKLEALEALAKEIGVENLDQVGEAAKFAANLYQANPVIRVGDKEIRLRKEPEIPDLDAMSREERIQWLQQRDQAVRQSEAEKAKAEIERLEGERKREEYLRKVQDNFNELKRSKAEITEDEWEEAQSLARTVKEIISKPDGGQTVEEVEALFKPFLLAVRASRAAKAAGLSTSEPAPKTSSIDAPQTQTKPPSNQKFNNLNDVLSAFKREKGIR